MNMKIHKEFDDLLRNCPEIKKEVLELFKKKEEVALRWLKSPRIQLCGVTPASLLETDKEKVRDLIYTIKIGDFS